MLGNKRDSHNTNGAILDYPKYLLNGLRCTWRCCQDKGHVGRIEFYPSDKKLQKKNLIAYISDLAGVFNVYPDQSSMIDFNSIMRAAGEIYVNKIMNTCSLTIVMNSLIQESSLPKITAFRSDSNSSLSSLSNQAPNTPKPFSVKFFTFYKLIFQSVDFIIAQTNKWTYKKPFLV